MAFTIHPQYIKDVNSKRSLVVVTISEFNKIMEELESIEDVKLYDQAKKKNTGKGILLDDYVHQREINNV